MNKNNGEEKYLYPRGREKLITKRTDLISLELVS